MQLRPLLKNLIILIISFVFLSSCTSNFNSEELEKLKVGTTYSELVDKVGTPLKTDSINRRTYNNSVIVDIVNGKVQNYFLTLANKNDAYSKIRIGMTDEEIDKLIGKGFKLTTPVRVYYKDHQQIILEDSKVVSIDLHAFQDLSILDKIRLNFNGDSMFVINISLAIIMFGVAIEIKLEHFKEVIKNPKSLIVGVFSQFIALPAITFLLILFIKPTPSVAMGMILVAACPGGNISNFMTSWAKGNSALSISLTAIATVAAIFATPLNFTFWGDLYASSSDLLIPFTIDKYQMLKTVFILLGIPVILGLLFRRYFEKIAIKIAKPLRIFSIVFFVGLILGAIRCKY